MPGPILTLAALHRLRQQALAQRALAAVRRFWSQVAPTQAQDSWKAGPGPAMVSFLTAVQAEAARGAQEYVAATVQRWGALSDPAGTVNTAALAGVAADGRPLDTLLSYPAFQVDAFVANGMAPADAMAIGQRHLERIAATETQDAARTATGVAQVNDRSVHGYVRMLTPPSCSRCAVLAGRFYKTNRGFERHPQCDCIMIPAVEHLPDLATDPQQYFDSLTPEEQNRIFTVAGAQAIRDGADIARTVNARRGMYEAGGRLFTSEATTRRGVNRRVRLTPEQIYREAAGNRDEALRLLRLHGYIL